MKKLLLISLLLLAVNANGAGIIKNASGDSTSFPFFALDSVGNIASLTTNDSVWLIVRYPNGQVAFRDSVAYNGTNIVAQAFSSYNQYAWREAVSDIDGTPVDGGVYSYCVIAKDVTSASLGTPYCGDRQLYTTRALNTFYDSTITALLAILAEVVNIDAWNPITDNDSLVIDGSVTRAQLLTYLAGGADSVQIDESTLGTLTGATVPTVTTVTNQVTADMTAVSGDAAAADSLEKLLDGTGTRLFVTDLAISDSLKFGTLAGNRFHLRAAGDDTAFVAHGSGSGLGGIYRGGTTGAGLTARGGSTSGAGLTAESQVGFNILLVNQGSGQLFYLQDTVQALIDTLQNQDNWVATVANQTLIKDTIQGIIDTLQNQDNWVATVANQTLIKDTLQGVIDTLQNQDNWVAQQTEVANIDGWNPITDNDSLIIDNSSLVVTATVDYEQVWYNIDTTNVDSSDIGDWFKNNIAGGAGSDDSPSAWDATDSTIVRKLMARIAWGDSTIVTSTLQQREVDVQAISDCASCDAQLAEALDGDATVGEMRIRYVDTAGLVTGGYIDSIVEGDGTGSFTYKAVDTANDVGAQYVSITARNKAGQLLGNPKSTDGNGKTTWGFTETDTVIFHIAENAGWTWATPDTIFGITDGGIDSTMGYSTVISSPPVASLSRVYGYVRGIQDDKKEGIKAIATFHTGKNQVDSVGEAVLVTDVVAEATADSTGYFFLDLRRTHNYADTTRGFYNIVGYLGTKQIFFVEKLWVPNSGNLNIGEVLAGRK